MDRRQILRGFASAAAVAMPAIGPARAQLETLRVAVALRGGWSTAAPELGEKKGIFAKRGLKLEILNAEGSGEAMQALISGSVDVSVALGLGQIMGAFGKGAPVRVIGGCFTGANDILWYVPSASPIRKLTDATGKTIAYGATGSSTHIAALSALQEFKVDAKPVLTGSYTSTLTQVMSGQVDVGWLAPPVGLQFEEDGKIRIIGSGDQLAKFKDQTVRITAANLRALEQRKDAITRFLQGYRDTLEWMYTGDEGVRMFAEVMSHPVHISLRTRDQYFPYAQMSPDRVTGVDGIMEDAIKFKLLPGPLTREQLQTLVQILPPMK